MTYIGHKDFYTEVMKGNIPGHSMVHKFGRRASVANGAWNGLLTANATYVLLSSAATLRLAAGDVNDDAGGTGAQSVHIYGLSATGTLQDEIIVTNGTTISASSASTYTRCFRVHVEDCGAYGGYNAGAVTVETTGGTDIIEIVAGEGQTQYGGYTIPLGYTGYLTFVNFTVDSGKVANCRIRTRENYLDATDPFEPMRIRLNFDGIIGSFSYKPRGPEMVLSALTDITAEAYGSGGTASVSVNFEILLVEDGY